MELVKHGHLANVLLLSKKFTILIQVSLSLNTPMAVYLLKKRASCR
jgi:hypothetical protein